MYFQYASGAKFCVHYNDTIHNKSLRNRVSCFTCYVIFPQVLLNAIVSTCGSDACVRFPLKVYTDISGVKCLIVFRRCFEQSILYGVECLNFYSRSHFIAKKNIHPYLCQARMFRLDRSVFFMFDGSGRNPIRTCYDVSRNFLAKKFLSKVII